MINEKRKLGFGLMRLPQKDGKIDIEKTCAFADKFIENGFCYFDTAYCYPGSEEAFREAISKRYPREKFCVATKMAGWLLNDNLTPQKMFASQLERCGVEFFDYYMLHSIQPTKKECYDKYGCWEFCLKKKAEGKIKNFGFSFHGKPELLEELLISHPEVDFVQLQINYIDWEDDKVVCAAQNYEIACKYNKKVIVMEPVRGGLLANLPPNAAKKLEVLKSENSQASYALRFAANLENVCMVLSGMNTCEQLCDNINTFVDLKEFSDIEKKAVNDVKNEMLSSELIACTACEYCVDGCAKKINIPEVFKMVNMKKIYGSATDICRQYKFIISQGSGKVSECIKCGKCEKACPQHINIIQKLSEAAELLKERQV